VWGGVCVCGGEALGSRWGGVWGVGVGEAFCRPNICGVSSKDASPSPARVRRKAVEVLGGRPEEFAVNVPAYNENSPCCAAANRVRQAMLRCGVVRYPQHELILPRLSVATLCAEGRVCPKESRNRTARTSGERNADSAWRVKSVRRRPQAGKKELFVGLKARRHNGRCCGVARLVGRSAKCNETVPAGGSAMAQSRRCRSRLPAPNPCGG